MRLSNNPRSAHFCFSHTFITVCCLKRKHRRQLVKQTFNLTTLPDTRFHASYTAALPGKVLETKYSPKEFLFWPKLIRGLVSREIWCWENFKRPGRYTNSWPTRTKYVTIACLCQMVDPVNFPCRLSFEMPRMRNRPSSPLQQCHPQWGSDPRSSKRSPHACLGFLPPPENTKVNLY